MKLLFYFFLITTASLASDTVDIKTNTEDEVAPDERSRELKLKKQKHDTIADRIFKNFNGRSQKDEEHQKKLMEQIEKDREKFKKLFGEEYQKFFKGFFNEGDTDFSFDDFDKIEKDMMQNMQKFFQGIPNAKGFSESFNLNKKLKHEWKLDKKSRKQTLILKLGQTKDQPIDIKIDKGSVKISGQFIEEKKTANSYSKKSYSINETIKIPEGLDEKKAEFKSINDDIHIIFPKK